MHQASRITWPQPTWISWRRRLWMLSYSASCSTHTWLWRTACHWCGLRAGWATRCPSASPARTSRRACWPTRSARAGAFTSSVAQSKVSPPRRRTRAGSTPSFNWWAHIPRRSSRYRRWMTRTSCDGFARSNLIYCSWPLDAPSRRNGSTRNTSSPACRSASA